MAKENIEIHYLDEDTDMPNNPALPVIVYRKIISGAPEDAARDFESAFTEHNWQGSWRGKIFDYHHYHPDAHEVLGIAAGHVDVALGGESGQTFSLNTGDMVVLPAGTGHKSLSASDDLMVVGAYPAGQEGYTICKNKTECDNVTSQIASVPLPAHDPFLGEGGPVIEYWHNTD